MYNVLIFGMNDNPGGIESFLLTYVNCLNGDEIHFDFLCNTKIVAHEEKLKKLGCNIYKITARSESVLNYQNELKGFFKNHAKNYDAIWVNICSLANIDYLKMAKKYGIKKRVIHSHNSQNMDSKLRGFLHAYNKKHIEQYATDFWACSETAGEWFYDERIRNGSHYHVITNAINAERFRYSEQIREEYRDKMHMEDKIVIGHIGRLHFQKNQEFLIKIFDCFQKRHPQSELIMIGAGEDEEKLIKQVWENGLQEKVRFLGLRDDIPQLLSAMDVFVFPSVFEGLSIVAMEVQASGLPVVASDNVLPDYAILSSQFRTLSLSEPLSVWCDMIEECLNDQKYNRDEYVERTKQKGFDIVEEARKVSELFLTP